MPTLTPGPPAPCRRPSAHSRLLQGVEQALEPARAAYEAAGAADKLELFVERGVGHECTPAMWARTYAFLDRHLLLPEGGGGRGGGGSGCGCTTM